MHEIPILFAQVAMVVVAMVGALAGIGLVTRALWRMTSRVTPRAAVSVTASDFQRLESAVEAIAVEVERISEAQRFTVALLSERMPALDAEQKGARGAIAPRSRANTPH